MSYRSSASFGKRQEFVAIAELLRRDFDVYLTLVDDQQIDCIVRKEVDGELVYLDIQIKARSKDCKPKNAGTFAALEVRAARPNCAAISSTTLNPRLWRVFAYSLPGFPRPMIKYIIYRS